MRILMYFLFLTVSLGFIGCGQKKANENFENQKKVGKGMTTDEVLEIMGPPDDIHEISYIDSWGDSVFIYNYESPFGFSGRIQVWFNHSDRRVRSVLDGL